MKKPWQEHSSKWDVPWDQRPEQNFDPDKVRINVKSSFFSFSLSLTALVAMLLIPAAVVTSVIWAVNNPGFNENPQFNHCKLVEDPSHPTGAYYRCHA